MQPHEHYLEAEEYLAEAEKTNDVELERYYLTRAQVHATLATVKSHQPPTADDIDYNAVVTMSENQQITHSYNPKCPPGCYGQYVNCTYKEN